MAQQRVCGMSYLKNVLIAIDQLINTLIGGYPDETLSSHAYRMDMKGIRKWPRKLIDTLLFFDKNHCEDSFTSERIGRQLPPECRP
jgi:hypothetical protein